MKYGISVLKETFEAWEDDVDYPDSHVEEVMSGEFDELDEFAGILGGLTREFGALTWSAHPKPNAHQDWLMSVDDIVDMFTGEVTRYSVHFTLPEFSEVDLTKFITEEVGVR